MRTLALLAALGVSLPLLAGFFGRWHPALDSFSHFRLHLAVLLGLTLLPLFALRSLKLGVPLMVAAFLAFATTSGAFPWIGMKYGAIHAAEPKRPLYRLVQLNLRYIHPEPALVLSMIGRIKPDVITFNEVSPSWAEKLKLIKATYRYSIFCPFPKRLWGVAIMSRRPFAEDGAPFCAPEGTFAIASVDFGGQTADIAALHLGWPWPFPQYREIGGLSPFIAQLGPTAILAGDLNAAPWSHSPALVSAAGGMTLMPSAGPSWLDRRLPNALFFAGLPIDQVFAKGDILVHSVRTLDPVGSDHLPVLVEFSLRPNPVDQTAEIDLASYLAEAAIR